MTRDAKSPVIVHSNTTLATAHWVDSDKEQAAATLKRATVSTQLCAFVDHRLTYMAEPAAP